MRVERTLGTALVTALLGIAALACLLWLTLASGADSQAVSGDPAQANCCPRIIGDQFFVSGKRYFIKGVNYYEKDHAWDLFWPAYCGGAISESVAHELDIARDLGVNTLRIFLRWEFSLRILPGIRPYLCRPSSAWMTC